MASAPEAYPARFRVDYPEKLDRLTTLLRIIWIIPIGIILAIISGSGGGSMARDGAERVSTSGPGIAFSLAFATALMIVFRQRYPRWWFDFQLALVRFTYRVGSYLFLLRDEYPSTEDEQAVHLELDYPDARQLNRWLPLIKWLLAVPHYLVLIALSLIGIVIALIAWLAILTTGRHPRGLFDYLVGVGRWGLRVQAYAVFLITDRYPPFSMGE